MADWNGDEFEVSVPWGIIAGRKWGSSNGHPWIAIHGWMDNAGSFDNLAPLFPQGHVLYCIDYPGHGHSSHLPSGVSYNFMESLIIIKRVAGALNLKVFSLLGHSMGAGMASLFTALHPQEIRHLILLDFVRPLSVSSESIPERTLRSANEFLSWENKMKSNAIPSYSYDKALKRLLEASEAMHSDSTGSISPAITSDSAKILLNRGLKAIGDDKYIFTRDVRLHVVSLGAYTDELLNEFVSRISVPHLIIKASGGRFYEDENKIKKTLSLYKENNSQFVYQEVKGSHHVHLNEASRVFPIIQEFLNRFDVN